MENTFDISSPKRRRRTVPIRSIDRLWLWNVTVLIFTNIGEELLLCGWYSFNVYRHCQQTGVLVCMLRATIRSVGFQHMFSEWKLGSVNFVWALIPVHYRCRCRLPLGVVAENRLLPRPATWTLLPWLQIWCHLESGLSCLPFRIAFCLSLNSRRLISALLKCSETIE